MKIRDSLIAVLVAFLWGAQVTAVKIGGMELPPILMVALRFMLMAAILLPFYGLPEKAEWRTLICIATITGALHFGLLYSGIEQVDASTSAVAYQLSTPFTVILAVLALGERIALHVIIGIVLSLAGMLFVVGGVGEGGALLGIVLVIAAALAFAVGTIVTKRVALKHNPMAMNGWVALIAAPELLLVSRILEGGQWGTVSDAGALAWGAVLYTAISGGLIGFGLWFWLLKRHPVQRLAPFTVLVPVFAIAVSQALLHESLSPSLIFGGVLVIAGVVLCQRRVRPREVVRVEPQANEST